MSATRAQFGFSRLAARAAALLAAFLVVLTGCASRNGTPGACKLPAQTQAFSPRFVLSSRVHYSQRDMRWAMEPIGGSGRHLGAVGCTVCCLSMALAQHGIDLTPSELNRALKKADGFTAKGWLFWPAVAQVTGGRARAEILWRPTLRQIEEALAAGNPVVVKIAPPPMIQHWVLLVGRDGRDFLVKDPLDGPGRTKVLSALGSPILAARVVRRTAP